MGALGPDGEGAEPYLETPATAPARRTSAQGASLAVLDVLDRDGQVRQTFAAHHWPLRVGRALDNDVVLSDPHVAARHLHIEPGASGAVLVVGESVNGVLLGSRRLRAGERGALPNDEGRAFELSVGRTKLRLRLAEQALAPEVPLAAVATRVNHVAPLILAALGLMGGLLFSTYLDTDPDGLTRALASAGVIAFVVTAVWCGLWALLSKTFTRQAHFVWHLRVFVFAAIGWLLAGVVPDVLAFALSWPWVSDYSFILTCAVAGAALYFHLLAVEPAHHRLLRWVGVTGAGVGIALMLWFNVQRTDRFGEELYMNHLFPPALRLARPIDADRFIDELAPLQALLDKKAKEKSNGDGADGKGSDEE
jgi:FHA domain